MKDGLKNVDIIIMLRLQLERMSGSFVPSVREYFRFYGIDREKLKYAQPDALILHPGPMNRGVEIDSELADDLDRSAIFEQVRMGVAVRMACLNALIKKIDKMNKNNPFNNKRNLKSYLLKNGKVINPKAKKNRKKDVLIENKVISSIEKNISMDSEKIEIINCENLYVSPGFVDMRVNLGEPGLEHKETIESACMAAASGGITSMICMPNTSPTIDQPAIIQSIQRKAREVALSKVFCTGCITRESKGEEISELQLMYESGAVGFTDGNKSVSNARVMKRALNYVKSFDGIVIQHAEEPELSCGGDVNESEVSTRMGLVGIPSYTEAMIVERDLWLVKDTNCRYHVSHISTKETVEIIRNAKKKGYLLPVTQHHLIFC